MPINITESSYGENRPPKFEKLRDHRPEGHNLPTRAHAGCIFPKKFQSLSRKETHQSNNSTHLLGCLEAIAFPLVFSFGVAIPVERSLKVTRRVTILSWQAFTTQSPCLFDSDWIFARL